MDSIQVIAIFDVGKTNKKLFLFDEKYNIQYEESIQLKEIIDDDGDACEDLKALTDWIKNTFEKILHLPGFHVKAINFSAYGASFVHMMHEGKALPLYNYLKPYPKNIEEEFYNIYGGKLKITKETASPASGNLNSGLQLYRIKKQQPQVFTNIRKSLHLPQYLSFLITNNESSDITSIGCHTSLWNFEKAQYHQWVINEDLLTKLAPIKKGDEAFEVSYKEHKLIAGIGLHDSSAALIPYLVNFKEPFILISTGTWCITLNPFNTTPLSEEELNCDCLCYLQYRGSPVKANRLFTGYQHEREIEKLAAHFLKPLDYYKRVNYNETFFAQLKKQKSPLDNNKASPVLYVEQFTSYETAYHHLMLTIIDKQVASTNLLLKGTNVKQIFVDGGCSKNAVYMNLLAASLPSMEVFAASMAQATALGAALAIHSKWNNYPIPEKIIELREWSHR